MTDVNVERVQELERQNLLLVASLADAEQQVRNLRDLPTREIHLPDPTIQTIQTGLRGINTAVDEFASRLAGAMITGVFMSNGSVPRAPPPSHLRTLSAPEASIGQANSTARGMHGTLHSSSNQSSSFLSPHGAQPGAREASSFLTSEEVNASLVNASQSCRDLLEPLARFHVARKRDITTFIILATKTLVLSMLFHNILGPFTPGLSRTESDYLKMVYKKMFREEAQERGARWRSLTYLHANISRDDRELAGRLSRDCVVLLQQTLLPLRPSTPPDVFTHATDGLTSIMLDAVRWQDTVRVSCLSHEIEAFLPSIGETYNAASLVCEGLPPNQTGNVIALASLGLRSWRNTDQVDRVFIKERKILIKAGVVIPFHEAEERSKQSKGKQRGQVDASEKKRPGWLSKLADSFASR